jgi:hypothetical protein
MTRLETWLELATRRLSRDSTAQVRNEIQEHYEAAHAEALSSGVSVDEADRLAVSALGDAKTANCQYRKVLLTSAEARVLRDARWEARVVCSHPSLKWLLPALPLVVLFAASIAFLAGASALERVLLVGGVGMMVWFYLPFLPVYTPARGRIARCLKWVALVGTLGLAFGPDALRWSWLLFSCLWPMAWIEWTRISVRRKLPVAEWPKALYL